MVGGRHSSVSIIMTARNAERHITTALNSGQTHLPQQKAIGITRGGLSAYARAGVPFAWGLLPRRLRLKLKS